MLDLNKVLELAVVAARATGPATLSHFRSPKLTVENKSDGSPVTAADREAEKEIRRIIEASADFGGFDIVGEEFGHDDRGSDYTWFIDPIDGTQAFARGIPTFGTLISLVDNAAQRSLAGVIQLHVLDETYAAARGLGATCNGQPIRVSAQPSLDGALISAAEPMWFEAAGLMSEYYELCVRAPTMRGYADCFGHAMVLRGGLDALIDPMTNPWDVRATEVIVEEAGGKFLMHQLSSGAPERARVAVIFGAAPVVDGLAELVPF